MKGLVWGVITICILLIGILGVVSAQCTDSDGGINPYVKGQIVGPIGPGEGSNGWDYCYNGEGTSISTTGKYLLEWSCTSDGAANWTIYQCPNGCKDGACVDVGSVLISLLNKASYRNGDRVGSNQSCNEYCQSFGETCVLGQFRVNDNSAYKSEFVRCEFKESGRQTNCVCAKSNPTVLTPICIPNCAGKQCGDDSCGGSCGSCGSGTVCASNGICLTQITPNETSGPIEIPPIPNSTPISDNNTFNNNSNQNLVCNGCSLNNKCYPYGFRLSQNYCDSDSSNFINQSIPNSVCNNNFECDSNLCVNNSCVSGSLWQKIMTWFSHLFGGK
jgi:hypothetical protein